ncbi:uncharacterized protein LOC143575497 [Bidens hawaiensis]|uniref:uncharacterized protein LOC143575497 n=1 Tax=Bidens hawaiensis TaxID=980011 RepID=UPI00404B083E
MTENNIAVNQSAPIIPVFKGEGYEHWSFRMKTILRARELWDVVYLGITAVGDGADNNHEAIKKGCTAKQTWEILQVEFQGDSQVQFVKLQGFGFRRAFENLTMKDEESVGDYFSRVMNNVGQQRSYGEELSDQKIVEKNT